MKNIAPQIYRQRLLIEGFYSIKVDKKVITDFFIEVSKELRLRMYGKPIIFSPAGMGKKENQGYDAFVPLIDSGISLYVWSGHNFFSIIIYTCKGFDNKKAVKFVKSYFKAKSVVFEEF